MQLCSGFSKTLVVLSLITLGFSQAAQAQNVRKFTNKTPTVRLCPSNCRAVNGHGLKPGGEATIYENRAGWVRVSPYLDRKSLVPSFGNKITKRPALWVPKSALASNKPAPKPAAKKKKAEKSKPAVKKAQKKAPKKTPKKVVKRVTVADRVARLRNVPRPTFRPNSAVVTTQPAETAVAVTQPVVTETPPVKTEVMKTEVMKTEVVKTEVVKEEPKIVVDTKPVVSAPKGAGSTAGLSWEEVQAKIASQGGSAKPVRTIVKDNSAAEQAKAAEQAAAAKRTKELEAAAAAAKDKADASAAAAAASGTKTAVVLPPKRVEKPAAKTQEPTFKSAEADPIALGARPKKLTKELLDKRLKKLPGRKSKVRKDVVIALRHYALGLLKSGECKGIVKGGASAVPGMLYVACSDDPSYLRQFPLEEESW